MNEERTTEETRTWKETTIYPELAQYVPDGMMLAPEDCRRIKHLTDGAWCSTLTEWETEVDIGTECAEAIATGIENAMLYALCRHFAVHDLL